MTIDFLWRLPTAGDARQARLGLWQLNGTGTETGHFADSGYRRAPRDRFTYGDYLAQVAKAADVTGFAGVLLPAGPDGEEPWTVAAALTRETRHLRFLPTFDTAIAKPVHIARASMTVQRHSASRIDWNIIAGENEQVQRRLGDTAPLEDRYRRNGEFLDIARGVLTEEAFSYQGRIYQVEKGGLQAPLGPRPLPTAYLSGASETALDIAARHADVYVTWLQPLEVLKRRIDDLRERAARHGRILRFAIRADIIARHDDDEAWQEARRLAETTDAEAARQSLARTSDEFDGGAAERDFVAPYAGATRFEDSVIAPHLWGGPGGVRPGASVVLVGGYANLAETLAAYVEAGIDSFILASSPHFDEAYRIGENLLPHFAGTARAAE
jgi:alkanesulfonate monooxygenase